MRTTRADAYNYDIFEPAPYVRSDCTGPTPGTSLAGIEVERLDGTATTLDALTDGVVVLATGSTTCPLYRRNIPKMRAVADRHPDATFVLLYTREAHPGARRGNARRHARQAVSGREPARRGGGVARDLPIDLDHLRASLRAHDVTFALVSGSHATGTAEAGSAATSSQPMVDAERLLTLLGRVTRPTGDPGRLRVPGSQ